MHQTRPGLVVHQDKARTHTSRRSMVFPQQKSFDAIPWSSKLLDWYPIEHISIDLNSRVRRKPQKTTTMTHISGKWNNCSHSVIPNIVTSSMYNLSSMSIVDTKRVGFLLICLFLEFKTEIVLVLILHPKHVLIVLQITVCRFSRGNQNTYIEKGQTIQ